MEKLESRFLLFRVTGYSMGPFLKDGQTVLISKGRTEDLRVGDIVLYQLDSDKKIAHRLIKIVKTKEGTSLYTRGDASYNGKTERVGQDKVIGKVAGVFKDDKIILAGGIFQVIFNWFLAKVYPGIRKIYILGIKSIKALLAGLKCIPAFKLLRKK